MLSNLGRREDALAASQEAVDIRRRLAQSRPDAFLPDLASSLNNLGGDLSNLGRREDALAASQEAVEIYRRIAHEDPTPSSQTSRQASITSADICPTSGGAKTPSQRPRRPSKSEGASHT